MEVFKELAKDCELYMGTMRDWRAPHAQSYVLYSLDRNRRLPPYNCTAPFWRSRREKCFEYIREFSKKPIVMTLIYVVHNEHSFCAPIQDSKDSVGFIPIQGNNSPILIGDNRNRAQPVKAMGIIDVGMIKTNETKQTITRLKEKPHLYGNKYYKLMLPKPDTRYFYFEVDYD